jgi:hypothetical protein
MADMQNLLVSLQQALENLTTLEIVTSVGALDVDIKGDGKAVTYTNLEPTASAVTRLKITGDIWTNRTENTLTGEYASVAEYHERMVEKSQAIVESNIRFLVEMVEKLRNIS